MVKNKVKEIYENMSVNKYPHVKRVVGYAVKIAKAENLSEREIGLIKIAALLHDVGYKKVFNEGLEDKHELYSCEICEEILHGQDLTEKEISLIKEIIITHSDFDKCKTKFQKILFDADKLDKTNMGELIRKSIIMYEKFKMDDVEIFERLRFKMNDQKFHFEISRKIAEENKKPIFESFENYKKFLEFTDGIEKTFNF
ncbi:hypothetical protein CMI46_01470 [Candidatus Pacearchaeota archaeon]|nr:hypothetical protein [Candidatus Pacearchaeota archaeon]